MNGHVFNYGADTCIKYEVQQGFHSKFTGTYYVKCDQVNCCKGGDPDQTDPDIKKWDIGQASSLMHDNITYLGKRETTELNGTKVTADAWSELFDIPFTKHKLQANYTFYVTKNGTDTITHRIDYAVAGQTSGEILFGDFKPQHDLDTFRKAFEAPAECLKPNTLTCPTKQMKEWDAKYFSRGPK